MLIRMPNETWARMVAAAQRNRDGVLDSYAVDEYGTFVVSTETALMRIFREALESGEIETMREE